MNPQAQVFFAWVAGLGGLVVLISAIARALSWFGKWTGGVDMKLVAIEAKVDRIMQNQAEHEEHDDQRFNAAEERRRRDSERLGTVERVLEYMRGKMGLDGANR
jgi:hypothetical protein